MRGICLTLGAIVRALRRANPPGAAARGDVAVAEIAEAGVIDVRYFRKRLRLAAGSSFGMCQEPPTVALLANGSNRPKADADRR
jgi:hypothetical protein